MPRSRPQFQSSGWSSRFCCGKIENQKKKERNLKRPEVCQGFETEAEQGSNKKKKENNNNNRRDVIWELSRARGFSMTGNCSHTTVCFDSTRNISQKMLHANTRTHSYTEASHLPLTHTHSHTH